MENKGELKEKIEDFLNTEAKYRKVKSVLKMNKWKTLKVKEDIYNRITVLQKLLGLSKSEVIDLSVLILFFLLHEKLKFPLDLIRHYDLTECVDEWNVDYGYVKSSCILKKIVLAFYKKKLIFEKLLKNIEELAQS